MSLFVQVAVRWPFVISPPLIHERNTVSSSPNVCTMFGNNMILEGLLVHTDTGLFNFQAPLPHGKGPPASDSLVTRYETHMFVFAKIEGIIRTEDGI